MTSDTEKPCEMTCLDCYWFKGLDICSMHPDLNSRRIDPPYDVYGEPIAGHCTHSPPSVGLVVTAEDSHKRTRPWIYQWPVVISDFGCASHTATMSGKHSQDNTDGQD